MTDVVDTEDLSNTELAERLYAVAVDRAGGGPSDDNFDPELLDVMSEAADRLARIGWRPAPDEVVLWKGDRWRAGPTMGTDHEATHIVLQRSPWTMKWVKTSELEPAK